MDNTLIKFIPKEGIEIVLVLFLSFLIGLEREEQKVMSEQYRFGGVRTFPLLGLLGYALCLFRKEISCCRLSASLLSERFFGNPSGTSLREWRWPG